MPRQSEAAKKRLERLRLERFRSQFAAFPAGELIAGEEPDFLVRGPTRTIGIELTELHREVPAGTQAPQAQESLRRRIAERAEALHVARGHPHLHAYIHFSGVKLSKRGVEPLAQALAGLIAETIPCPAESLRIEVDYANLDRLPGEISSITTYNLPGAERSFFSTPGSTWMAHLQPGDVERALKSKDEKYRTYREKCDEAWLVIGCNGEFMSTWFEGVDAAAAFELPTPFDRVFVMSYFDQMLVEL